MSNRKVSIIIGTRPEAIKMIPVARDLKRSGTLDVSVIVTGQHRQMLDQVFDEFCESPDIDLGLMRHDQGLSGLTIDIIREMSALFERFRPDLVLVHGDTTTAMSSALAAFYGKIPVGHVEAGLRSGNIKQPWPEEYNRIAIDAVSELLFAPTESAAVNLRRERPEVANVFVTGNTGIDALLYMSSQLNGSELSFLSGKLSADRHLILVTGHRRESFDGGFERICEALSRLARREDIDIVYPVHLNPKVSDVVQDRLRGIARIHLTPPVGYAQMVALMTRARLILTDSGGVQEEAPALGKPVLVMREVTERPEALQTGVASLVGTDPERIIAEVNLLLDDDDAYAERARCVFPYGDGRSSERITRVVKDFLGS